ncbi:putative insertion sequence 2 OrfA protein [Candidatus Erwinia dacicola]|uniref:Insertion sequence 2 OrfA protein n=1 Tax=Candidatus Erwinia dacicola TaxID=252393 RepID=A0A328TLD3_9GAMM|nr:putative insertion sequence 2 OrfA protein [Candidatus Erwinia dacicola]
MRRIKPPPARRCCWRTGRTASELVSAMKQIKELQRLLGKKTMENELLKEAVEYGR